MPVIIPNQDMVSVDACNGYIVISQITEHQESDNEIWVLPENSEILCQAIEAARKAILTNKESS